MKIKPMDIKEEKDLMEIRQFIYSFLATSFLYPPNADQVKNILQEHLFDEFPLEIADEDFNLGLRRLQSWAHDSDVLHSDINEVLNRLQQDYMALFLGPGHLLAAPWESVYLTEEKLTFGVPTIEVRKFYLRHGYELERKNSEPDDHFGMEMEFMAKLIGKQIQNLNNEELEEANLLATEQLLFLQEHILKWMKDFTDNVVTHAQTPYFQGLALIARGYLNWDRGYLEALPELLNINY